MKKAKTEITTNLGASQLSLRIRIFFGWCQTADGIRSAR